MNCRKCGRRIPGQLLQQNRFQCPACGEHYRKRAPASAKAPSSANIPRNREHAPKALSIIRALLTKRIWKLPLWVYIVMLLFALPGATPSDPPESLQTTLPTAAPTPIATAVPTPVPTLPPATAVPIEEPVAAEIAGEEPSSEAAALYQLYDQPTTAASANDITQQTIQLGDSGEKVAALQKKLISLGYLSGKADGYFGDKTKKAVMAYQKKAGLYASGVCDYDTYVSMTGANAPRNTITQRDTNKSSEQKVWFAPDHGEKYHRENCRTIRESENKRQITMAEAKKRNLGPCGVCQ